MTSRIKVRLGLATYLIVLLPCCFATKPDSRTLFGITLSPPAADLLELVEMHYGAPVIEEIASMSDPTRLAEAAVDTHGRAVIRVSKNHAPSEAVLVQQLFRLKLQAGGFPDQVVWEWPAGQDTAENAAYVERLYNHVLMEIIHAHFYPYMRCLGFEPDLNLREDVERILAGTQQGPGTAADTLAIFYFKFTLHLTDPALRRRIDEWYEKKDWLEGLSKGREMVKLVTSAHSETPDEIMSVFVRCISLIVHKVHFEFQGWEEAKLGRHLQRTAVIRVW